jgi:hypothetical protein
MLWSRERLRNQERPQNQALLRQPFCYPLTSLYKTTTTCERLYNPRNYIGEGVPNRRESCTSQRCIGGIPKWLLSKRPFAVKRTYWRMALTELDS